MKSSYKLFGVYWDGKPIPEKIPKICVLEKDYLKNRSLVLTEILRNENVDEKEAIKGEWDMIRIDYIPKFLNRCVLDFYICRLLQIAQYYNVEIVCDNERKKEKLTSMIDDYYKRKHLSDCWRNQKVLSSDMLNIPNRK